MEDKLFRKPRAPSGKSKMQIEQEVQYEEFKRKAEEAERKRQEYFQSRVRIGDEEREAIGDLMSEWLRARGEAPRRLSPEEMGAFNHDMKSRIDRIMFKAQCAMNALKIG